MAEPAAAAGSAFSWGSYSKYLKLIKRLKCSHADNSFGAFLEEISVSSVRLSVPWSWKGSHPKALLCAVQCWSRSSLMGLALPWGPQTPLCFALLPPALPCPMGSPQLCPTSQQPHSGPCPRVRCPHGRGPTRGPWWGQPVCPTTCCLASSLLVREPEMPKPLIFQCFQLTMSKEIPTSGNAEWRMGLRSLFVPRPRTRQLFPLSQHPRSESEPRVKLGSARRGLSGTALPSIGAGTVRGTARR